MNLLRETDKKQRGKKMIDIYVASFLVILNAVGFFLVGITYFIKSASFLRYLESNQKKIYRDVLGYSETKYNSFAFIGFTFSKKTYQDERINSEKKWFKKTAITLLLNVGLATLFSFYLYIRLNILS
jgi:hypothetical protein